MVRPRHRLSPLHAGLLGMLAAAAAPWNNTTRAANRWPDERRAGPFICHADFSLAPQATLLNQMAQLQTDLASTLELGPIREPVHLFLFQRKSTYRGYLGMYFPKVPYRRALFIKDRGPGMVFAYQNSEFEIDLRHESTHALLHAVLPVVPLWLDEGLAEYFEVSPAQRAFGHDHLSRVRWSARLGQVPKIEKLERLAALDDMGQAEYRQAWAWVHFMIHGPEAAGDELQRFLDDLEAHAPPGILSERLRRRIPALEHSFVEHFKHWKRPTAAN